MYPGPSGRINPFQIRNAASPLIGPGPRPAVAPVTALSLTDNFDDNSRDVTKWVIGELKANLWSFAGYTILEQNQRLEVTPVASTTATAGGYVSANFYNMSGKAIFAKITIPGGLPSGQEAYISFGTDEASCYLGIITGGSIFIQENAGGITTSTQVVAAYNATTHAWLRFRHNQSDDRIYLDTAPSTASDPPAETDWVTRGSQARTMASSTVTNAKVALGSDTFNAGVSSPATIQFDAFCTATTAGTTTYNVTISGTLLVAPTIGVSGSYLRTVASSVVLFGSADRQASVNRIISGLVAIPASIAVGRLYARSISGAVAVSATLAKAATFVRSIAGSVAVSASFAKVLAAVRSISGLIAVRSSVTTQAAHVRTVAAPVVVEGSVATQAAHVRTISGLVAVTSFVAASKAYLRTVAGSVALFGSTARVAGFVRTITGAVTTSGSIARVTSALRSISGAVATSVAVQRVFTARRTVAASSVVSGTIGASRAFLRTVSGSVAVSSVLVRQASFQRLISGLLAVRATVARGAITFSRTISGAVTVTGSAQRAAIINRSVTAAVAIFAAIITGNPHPFVAFGPVVRFLRDLNPFPRAVRENRPAKF